MPKSKKKSYDVGHYTRRNYEEYAELKTFEDILQFMPNRQPPHYKTVCASRLPAILAQMKEKLTFPVAVDAEKVQELCRAAGVSDYPPQQAINLTLVVPVWLVNEDEDPTDFSQRLETMEAATAWATQLPDLKNQSRFVQFKLPGSRLHHAGLATVLNQFDDSRTMLYFEPQQDRGQDLPEVAIAWARLAKVKTITIVHGNQRAHEVQCVREVLRYFVRWSCSNQNLPIRGGTRTYDVQSGNYGAIQAGPYKLRENTSVPLAATIGAQIRADNPRRSPTKPFVVVEKLDD